MGRGEDGIAEGRADTGGKRPYDWLSGGADTICGVTKDAAGPVDDESTKGLG